MLCKCSSFYSLFISVIAAGTKLFLKSLVLDLGTENLFPEGRSWLAAELVGYPLYLSSVQGGRLQLRFSYWTSSPPG